MPERNWYYSRGGQQLGPVDTAQLKELFATGELAPSDLIWTDTMINWAPASTVKGLFATETAEAAHPHAGAAETSPGAPAPNIKPEPAEAKSMSEPVSTYSPQFKAATQLASEAFRNAWSALRSLITDPVGGMGKAYQQLSGKSAMQVGIAFLVVFALIAILALSVGVASVSGVAIVSGGSATAFFKGLLLLVVGLGAMIGVAALFRKLTRSSAGIAADLFIVGASVLPVGLSMLFASLVNVGSQVVSAIVMAIGVFAVTFTILMLYGGLTQITRLSARLASLAVPSMLVAVALAIWLIG